MMRVNGLFIGMFSMCLSTQASIVYLWTGTAPTTPSNCGSGVFACYEWTYTAQIAPDQRIDSTVGRNFGVIYDFLGYSGVAFSTPLVGGITVQTFPETITDPQPVGQVVNDRTGMNVRTEISGSYTPADAADLFTVTAYSRYADLALGTQSAQAVSRQLNSSSDFLVGNSTPVESPSAPVPEPGSGYLISFGLFAIAVVGSGRQGGLSQWTSLLGSQDRSFVEN